MLREWIPPSSFLNHSYTIPESLPHHPWITRDYPWIAPTLSLNNSDIIPESRVHYPWITLRSFLNHSLIATSSLNYSHIIPDSLPHCHIIPESLSYHPWITPAPASSSRLWPDRLYLQCLSFLRQFNSYCNCIVYPMRHSVVLPIVRINS